MILTNVIFGACREGVKEQLKDIAESYLGSLLHSGQLCGEYFIAWTKKHLTAYVQMSGPRAFDLRHHSPWGKKELKNVVDAFGRPPVWRVLEDDAEQRASSWKKAPFLYLFTHAFDRASPVCRADKKPPVPAYALPISFEQKEGLYFWQGSYRDHDSIWLASGKLELPAYRQLADPNSELSRQGRELCREIEAATGVPTFYYLMRHWGRPKREHERKCPGCGRSWHIGRVVEEPAPFQEFDFRCDRCRLVSHLGVSTDGGRHTRIGEFRGEKRGRR